MESSTTYGKPQYIPYATPPYPSSVSVGGPSGSRTYINTGSKQCSKCEQWLTASDPLALDMMVEHHENMHVIEDLSKTLVTSMFEMVDRMNMILDRLDRRTRDE